MFSKWLGEKIEETRLSQREIAKLSGISQSLISQVVSARSPATANFCVQIAPVIGETPETVMRLAGILPPEPPQLPDDDPALAELLTLARRLPPDKLQEVIDFVWFKLGRS